MGITGLLGFVKDAIEEIHIKKYAGQVVAVDTYCWIHRGSFACAEKLAKKEKTDQYVKYCMKFIDMLLTYNVKPILVFDGCRLPSKELVEQSRHQRRKQNLDKGRQLLREGKVGAARDCFTKCISVTPAMALEVMEAARNRGVDCIVAPYEADAQLAYFSKHNIAQAIVTEDSDLLCFGCETVIFKMDLTGRAQEVRMSNLGRVKRLVGFTPDLFRQMCILSGCDYLPSVKGVGLVKACKALKLSKSKNSYQVAKKLHQYIKGLAPVKETYGTEFERADKTFLYQLVFDPEKRKILPLNEYPPGVIAEDLTFAGPYISDDKALQIALGNIDINTQLVVAYFDVDVWVQNQKPISKWPSIWNDKLANRKVTDTTSSFVSLSKSVPEKGQKQGGKVVQNNPKILSANEVLDAVINYSAPSKANNKKEGDPVNTKNSPNNVSTNDLHDLVLSYGIGHSSNDKHKSRSNNLISKRNKPDEIVKSRFFASLNESSERNHDFSIVPETDCSSSSDFLKTTELLSSDDAVLNDILSEMTMQSKNRVNEKDELSPNNKRKHKLDNSAEGLETFLRKRKRKKLSIPSVSRYNSEKSIRNNDTLVQDQLENEVICPDDCIPILDKNEIRATSVTEPCTTREKICNAPNSLSSEKYLGNTPDTLDKGTDKTAEDGEELLDEGIPVLDNSAVLCKDGNSRQPLAPKNLINNSNFSPVHSPLKNSVISVSSEDEENSTNVSSQPQKIRLGLRMKGRFKSPVKLNFSKYFTGAKASGLQKSSKRKTINKYKQQPSIARFFQPKS